MPVPVYVNGVFFENFPGYNERSNKRRYLWVTLLIIFIILVVVAIIFYFTMVMPKLPHFYVNSLSLTNFTTSTNIVTATWHVGILVQNPNKFLNIKFILLQPTIYYKDQNLSESQIMPFKQSSRSNTILNVTFSAVNVKVEKYFLDGINKERKLGSVGFNVKLDGHVKFKYYKKRVRVLCSDIVVRISSNSISGKLDGGAKNCHVDSN